MLRVFAGSGKKDIHTSVAHMNAHPIEKRKTIGKQVPSALDKRLYCQQTCCRFRDPRPARKTTFEEFSWISRHMFPRAVLLVSVTMFENGICNR